MYPTAYLEYLAHFHGDRDYFECHEILEEYWKETEPRDKNSFWVALIQIAVSCYHHRRGNFRGAIRTLQKAILILEPQSEEILKFGLDEKLLPQLLTERLEQIEQHKAYKSFNLPLKNEALVSLCQKVCQHKGFLWGQESDISNTSLIHRHKLRDRTSVIQERMKSLQTKKGSE